MLLSTGRTVALRCPLCGRFALHGLNLFALSRHRVLRISCICGFTEMTISSQPHKDYQVQIVCLACAGSHSLRLNRRDLGRSEEIIRLRCPELGTEIGLLGPDQAVRREVEENRDRAESVANDAGFDNFFNQPDVMLKVLSHLHVLAENRNLYCQCGNCRIEVEAYPDKLELRCVSCHSLLIVYAETREDLSAVLGLSQIVMSERGFASIDATKMSQER